MLIPDILDNQALFDYGMICPPQMLLWFIPDNQTAPSVQLSILKLSSYNSYRFLQQTNYPTELNSNLAVH